jgi:hypothetical protein
MKEKLVHRLFSLAVKVCLVSYPIGIGNGLTLQDRLCDGIYDGAKRFEWLQI